MNWRRQPQRRGAALAAGVALVSLTATACAGAGGSSNSGGGSSSSSSTTKGATIHVLMVNNPQMIDLEHLTAGNFTKQTGIKVNFTTLPEDNLRDKASQEFSSQAGQYDVATLSNFEIPFYSKNGWLAPLDSYISKDTGFDQSDILKPIASSLTGSDGKVYGEPFYGESSFLMYRKDVFAAKHLTMPANPTWNQVAALAKEVDRGQAGHEGHLPARPDRLGRGAGPADHRGQHVRRHLVRPRTGRPRSTRPRSSRPPTSTSTWSSSTARPARRSPGSPSA